MVFIFGFLKVVFGTNWIRRRLYIHERVNYPVGRLTQISNLSVALVFVAFDGSFFMITGVTMLALLYLMIYLVYGVLEIITRYKMDMKVITYLRIVLMIITFSLVVALVYSVLKIHKMDKDPKEIMLKVYLMFGLIYLIAVLGFDLLKTTISDIFVRETVSNRTIFENIAYMIYSETNIEVNTKFDANYNSEGRFEDLTVKLLNVYVKDESGVKFRPFLLLSVAAALGLPEVTIYVLDQERVTELSFAPFSILRQKVKINVKDERGRTALHTAVIRLNLAKIESLLDQGADKDIQDEDGFTPYQIALVQGFVKVVQPFLAPNSRVTLQKEALAYLAAQEGNSSVLDRVLSKASQSTGPGLVQAMMEYEDEHGTTALHIAAKKMEPEALKKLIQYVTRPEKANKEGKAALDIVLERRKDVNSVARILAEKSGVAVDLENGMSLIAMKRTTSTHFQSYQHTRAHAQTHKLILIH